MVTNEPKKIGRSSEDFFLPENVWRPFARRPKISGRKVNFIGSENLVCRFC